MFHRRENRNNHRGCVLDYLFQRRVIARGRSGSVKAWRGPGGNVLRRILSRCYTVDFPPACSVAGNQVRGNFTRVHKPYYRVAREKTTAEASPGSYAGEKMLGQEATDMCFDTALLPSAPTVRAHGRQADHILCLFFFPIFFPRFFFPPSSPSAVVVRENTMSPLLPRELNFACGCVFAEGSGKKVFTPKDDKQPWLDVGRDLSKVSVERRARTILDGRVFGESPTDFARRTGELIVRLSGSWNWFLVRGVR